MKYAALIMAAAALTACAHFKARSLAEIHSGDGWRNDAGAKFEKSFDRDVRRALKGLSRSEARTALQAEKYECVFGEASAGYVEPAIVCTRIFATRACQGEWDVMMTSDPGKPGAIDEITTDFRRDCVGRDDDWPEPKDSAIDDQLAPPPVM